MRTIKHSGLSVMVILTKAEFDFLESTFGLACSHALDDVDVSLFEHIEDSVTEVKEELETMKTKFEVANDTANDLREDLELAKDETSDADIRLRKTLESIGTLVEEAL